MAREKLRYIELKTGHNDNGPAWVALTPSRFLCQLL
jgi:hypothetical protein